MATTPPSQPSPQGLTGFVRISGTPEDVQSALGPLADLAGSWVGKGWNMVAVPDKNDFLLLVQPYVEVITFTPLGAPVPNRGGPVGTTFISGLHYDLKVADAETNQPLHIENGMWLLLSDNSGSGAPTIARSASIPHGDSLLALGDWGSVGGGPSIPILNPLPITGAGAPLGYTDPYLTPLAGFDKSNPNQFLLDKIRGQIITETIMIRVSTAPPGAITNIPFISSHANAAAFSTTLWIETVKNADGSTFQQLQYSQQTTMQFLPRFDDPTKLIEWPHINVNTLVKQ